MTKLVRIENADTSNYKVSVKVYDNGNAEPTFQEILAYPTAMSSLNVYLTSTRHIVIEEVPGDIKPL